MYKYINGILFIWYFGSWLIIPVTTYIIIPTYGYVFDITYFGSKYMLNKFTF